MGSCVSKRVTPQPEPEPEKIYIVSSSDDDLLYDVPIEINEIRIKEKNRICAFK